MTHLTNKSVLEQLLEPIQHRPRRTPPPAAIDLSEEAFNALRVLHGLQWNATLREQVKPLLNLDTVQTEQVSFDRPPWSEALPAGSPFALLEETLTVLKANA